MKYVVAVSGGVDSVVLLDMMTKRIDNHLIVAHFDHGIRPDSAADARFVEALACKYRLPFISKREELGANASEEKARLRRYYFLHAVAAEHGAGLVVAHHQDDLIETIAQNIARGTGWRGLAVFGDERIRRPLLHKTKVELYDYALINELEWVEDETNHDDSYARNLLRRVLHAVSPEARLNLVRMYTAQHGLAAQIKREVRKINQEDYTSRYFLAMVPEAVANELLRQATEAKLHRLQLQRLLHAIKTQKAGTAFEAGSGIVVHFTKRDFVVQTTP